MNIKRIKVRNLAEHTGVILEHAVIKTRVFVSENNIRRNIRSGAIIDLFGQYIMRNANVFLNQIVRFLTELNITKTASSDKMTNYWFEDDHAHPNCLMYQGREMKLANFL